MVEHFPEWRTRASPSRLFPVDPIERVRHKMREGRVGPDCARYIACLAAPLEFWVDAPQEDGLGDEEKETAKGDAIGRDPTRKEFDRRIPKRVHHIIRQGRSVLVVIGKT